MPHSLQDDDLCTLVETLLACGEHQSDTVSEHLQTCVRCREFSRQMHALELALQHALPESFGGMEPTEELADRFADRVMAKINDKLPDQTPNQESGNQQTSDWLLPLFSKTKWQNGLLSFGVIMGLYHIARFFLGLFLASMVAAG